MNFIIRMLLLVIGNIGSIAAFYVFTLSYNIDIRSTRLIDLDVNNPINVQILCALIGLMLVVFCINYLLFSVKSSSSSIYDAKVILNRFLITRYFSQF